MKQQPQGASEAAMPNKRIRLLGVPLDIIDSSTLDVFIENLLFAPGVHQIVFLRTRDLMRARRSSRFMKCLRDAALVVPVSRRIQLACKLLRIGTPIRYAPFDFMIRLLNTLESKHGSIYLLGDRQPFLSRMETNLRQTFPGTQFLGRYTGDFSKGMEKNIILAISKAAPNLLLTGGGLKGRNLWVHLRKKNFPRGIQVWCAECFDYFTARKKRPTKTAFQKGREYYREAAGKPWRVFTFPVHILFSMHVLLERLRAPHKRTSGDLYPKTGK